MFLLVRLVLFHFRIQIPRGAAAAAAIVAVAQSLHRTLLSTTTATTMMLHFSSSTRCASFCPGRLLHGLVFVEQCFSFVSSFRPSGSEKQSKQASRAAVASE
jgi:hypothetical protein